MLFEHPHGFLVKDGVARGQASIPLEAWGGGGKSPADKHLDPAIVIQKEAAGGERWGGTRDGPGPGGQREAERGLAEDGTVAVGVCKLLRALGSVKGKIPAVPRPSRTPARPGLIQTQLEASAAFPLTSLGKYSLPSPFLQEAKDWGMSHWTRRRI